MLKKEQSYQNNSKNCIKKFCEDLKELATEIINYDQKEMIPFTDKEINLYERQKVCYKKYDKNKKSEYELYHKVRDHCYYTGKVRAAAHNICNLRYKVLKKIPIVFHNGSIYDYHFIVKQLAEDFKGQFECIGENTEKYITFSVPIKKEVANNDKKKSTYKLAFINSYKFMQSKLSDFVDNLFEINKKNFQNAWGKKLNWNVILLG